MSERLAVVSLMFGIMKGATVMEAAGPRSAGAQSAAEPGQWMVVAQEHGYPAAAAWRLNTVTGELGFCSRSADSRSGWRCVPVEVRAY